jgi:hypothetical protein
MEENKKMRWEKIGTKVYGNGEKDITYEGSADPYRVFRIVSRKRAIPHANGRPGVWYHTTYFLLDRGTETEFVTMKEAKEEAERRAHEAGEPDQS